MSESKSHYHNSNKQPSQEDRIKRSFFCNFRELPHNHQYKFKVMKVFYLFNLFQIRNLVVNKLLHALWDHSVSYLLLLQRNKSSSSCYQLQWPSSKNIQASTIASSAKLGMATTNSCIDAINCSQPKAHNQLQSQSTKEAKVQTIISYDPLARNKVINKDISTLKHLKY